MNKQMIMLVCYNGYRLFIHCSFNSGTSNNISMISFTCPIQYLFNLFLNDVLYQAISDYMHFTILAPISLVKKFPDIFCRVRILYDFFIS